MSVSAITLLVLLASIVTVALYLLSKRRKQVDQSDAISVPPKVVSLPESTLGIRTESKFDKQSDPSSIFDSMDLQLLKDDELNKRYKTDSEPLSEPTPDELVALFGKFDPKLDLASYQYPNLELLDVRSSGSPLTIEELEYSKGRIVDTLLRQGIEIDRIKATLGPTVTFYEIVPMPGIRISRIMKLEDDIALALSSDGTRITGHILGTNSIGIEVPHKRPEIVSIRSLLATKMFQDSDMLLPLALGKTMDNHVYLADLTHLPHLLVAGATGQGKSVAISAMITSLLYKKHPAELKFVLVDLNKIELAPYHRIERHFLAKLPSAIEPVVTTIDMVAPTLEALFLELDNRYDLFKSAQVRTIHEYNDKFINRKLNPEFGHRFLPFIVLVIDEFADLMVGSDRTIESLITRLAQRGRPAGIHLIISTQRPSVNIITGSIKANISGRLSLKVASAADSNTILDNHGAERLKGDGDLLFSTGLKLTNLQGALVSTDEISKVNEFISIQRGYPTAMLLPEDDTLVNNFKEFDPNDRDPMFEEAARLVVLHQQGSPSLIQRKLKLGYNRAGRIIDQLEAAGIVGPFEGIKAREVLYPDEYSLELRLNEYTANKGKKGR